MKPITEAEYRALWREQVKVGRKRYPDLYRTGHIFFGGNQYTNGSRELSMTRDAIRKRERRAAALREQYEKGISP